MDSLYDAIGGLPALEVAVQRFCERACELTWRSLNTSSGRIYINRRRD